MAEPSATARSAPRRQLTLVDSTAIIVGIIIGSGMYKAAPTIAAAVPSPAALLLVWLAGGAFALVGSLCYAELATAMPHEGGDYVYLSRAYGRPVGFLFAWCELWMIRSGAIGSLAFVFADYFNEVLPLGRQASLVYAGGAVAVLTAVNMLGVTMGKWTQNLLTLAKVSGLLAVVGVGFLYSTPATAAATEHEVNWGLAMIMILYAYGGWNDMAYVGAEVRDPERNIVRALLLGTLVVTLVYVLVNAAFVHALGIDGMRNPDRAVAAEVVRLAGGEAGARAVSLLVAVSALGAVNGMIFTGARVYYALGTEHRLFSPLGVWNARFDTPLAAILIQGGVALALVVTFAGNAGGGFEQMVNVSFPPFWLFLLLVGAALFRLRWREPEMRRPFRTPGYPLTPLLFCAGAAFMLWASVSYAYARWSREGFWTLGVLAIGLLAAWFDHRSRAGGHN
ncbi:MAG TPA: amino acid permease [Pirellulales bacterium]